MRHSPVVQIRQVGFPMLAAIAALCPQFLREDLQPLSDPGNLISGKHTALGLFGVRVNPLLLVHAGRL